MIKIVDLFCGAGGLTFGFYYRIKKNKFVRNEKFEFLFANEFDHHAANSFRNNFSDIPLLEEDICKLNTDFLEKEKINYENVDVVIGGPPCQSYSTVGKRQYDQRAKMYHEYIRLLSILKPKIFIFENVTGLLSMKNDSGSPIIKDIESFFQKINKTLGYKIYNKVLNAKDFGVPQSRERVFIVGIRNDLDLKWEFPKKTHGEEKGLKQYLTVFDAISDLPVLKNGEVSEKYLLPPKNSYQKLMRRGSLKLMDHRSGRHGDKMMTVMQNLKQGESRPDINKLVEKGFLDKRYYLTSGFRNTYGRLWENKPSTTITNSLGTPSALRCIHPLQDRALSTREGARLQSFPDWIRFSGNKNQKNSQVGNAVPPLLAMQFASIIENLEF